MGVKAIDPAKEIQNTRNSLIAATMNGDHINFWICKLCEGITVGDDTPRGRKRLRWLVRNHICDMPWSLW